MTHTQETLPGMPDDRPQVKRMRLQARDRESLRGMLYDAIEEIYEAREAFEITAEACFKLVLAYSAELNKSYQFDENQKRRKEIEDKLQMVLDLIQGTTPQKKSSSAAIEVVNGTGENQSDASG